MLIFSILGGLASNSSAFAIKAAATLRFAPRVVRKGVEDPKFPRSHVKGIPGDGGRFCLDQRQSAREKIFQIFFFARLGLECNPYSFFDCHNLPFVFLQESATLPQMGQIAIEGERDKPCSVLSKLG